MILVVQRGHVPRTTGATGAPGEQRFAIETADRIHARMHDLGHVVKIIDADVPDSSYRGDAFVAIHYDSSLSPSAHGASVGYQSPEGQRFAHAWKRHYEWNGWTQGFRGDNYTAALGGYYGVRRAVANGNRMAFISESGFHSNPDDAALLASPFGPDRTAIAVTAAVVDIFGATCPPSQPPAGIPPYPGLVAMGDRGPAVAAWQRQLAARGYAIAVDGIFGPVTNHIVIDWQRNHGLVADGIAGPATWHSLVFG